jgi:kanamycin nucleotidyltransferase
MNIALRDSVPAGHSHQQRLDVAGQLASLILDKHGNTVVAIVVFGTTAIEQDGPYSDLDMTVVTRDDIGGHSKSYPFLGLQINLDYQTIEESFEEAREPHAGGCWVKCLSLYDPHDMVAKFGRAFRNVTRVECGQAFATIMQDNLATDIGKIRNSIIAQDRASLIKSLQHFGEQVCRVLCIINGNQDVTGTARLRDETKALGLLPPGFPDQIDKVTGANPVTEQEMYEAAEDIWAGIIQIARREGLEWEARHLRA